MSESSPSRASRAEVVRGTGEVLRFRFAFARPELLAGRLFGVTPSTAEVVLDGDRFVARFGPWRVETPLANIAGAELTGPYRWPKIVGPAHLSLKDRGLTFASNPDRGVCVRFHHPVRGIDALGVIRHPALTVTVADAPALVEVLQAAAQVRTAGPPAASRPETTVDEVVGELVDDLHGMTAHELRDRARELGIAGVSSMKKDELVDALLHHAAGGGQGGPS